MDAWTLIAAVLVGLAVGAVVAVALLRRGNRLAIDSALASSGADAQARLAAADALRAARDEDLRALQARLDAATQDARAAQQALVDTRVANASLATELREERERAGEKLATLMQAREELSAQFKALAGDALEVNRKRLTEQHHGALEQILKPLGEKIVAFEQKVVDTHDKESEQRTLLRQEVVNLQQATARINEDAVNLTRALKGEAKTRGNWGEVVLERVLERSGLQKDREYETQFALKGDEGNALRPDVVIRLPDGKHIVIDAKVSLVAYDRYYAATDDAARAEAGRQHVDAVRKHARDLGAKGYHTRSGLDSPDFVAMFVPIEPALGLASSLDESLFVDAWERKVVIVTPSTLLAVLTTVRTLWQREKQNRNAIEIAEKAGGLYDQFTLVLESFDAVGAHLEKASRAFDSARMRLKTGKGNVVGRVELIREMGAKAKRQLPEAWTDGASEGDAPSAPVASKLTLVAPPDLDAEPR
jgi:DNA recombination protein RmuC